MTPAYRLHAKPWPASSGKGAAISGARWNPIGVEVIYAASNPSLAVLEILVQTAFPHLSPTKYDITEIHIPDTVKIEHIPARYLPANWNALTYSLEAQEFGERWVHEIRSCVLSVPSSVMWPVPTELNFSINPLHPNFAAIEFLPSEPFRFDPRLR